MKAYCFTIDDNIRFFEESTKNNLDSLFNHPYLAMLQDMHFLYGAKFQLYVYYAKVYEVSYVCFFQEMIEVP